MTAKKIVHEADLPPFKRPPKKIVREEDLPPLKRPKTKALKPAIWQARPTVYRGVQMRSRLEAAWAEQFDAWTWDWEYEPSCYASAEGQYLPDFKVPTYNTNAMVPEDPPLFIEVKTMAWIMTPTRQAFDEFRRMFRILRSSVPDARFWIVTNAADDGHIRILQMYDDGSLYGYDKSGSTPVASLHSTGFYRPAHEAP